MVPKALLESQKNYHKLVIMRCLNLSMAIEMVK